MPDNTPATQPDARARMEALLAKKRKAAPVAAASVVEETAEPAHAVSPNERDQKIMAEIRENEIYKIRHDESLSKSQQVDQIVALLKDPRRDADVRIEMIQDYISYIQIVRRTLAVNQIKATADKIHSSYQQTMDDLYKDLGGFQGTVAPLREVFELIQKYAIRKLTRG